MLGEELASEGHPAKIAQSTAQSRAAGHPHPRGQGAQAGARSRGEDSQPALQPAPQGSHPKGALVKARV
jgi:hypothetical protein